MNPNNVSAWIDGPSGCIWHQHGVWDIDPMTNRPRLLLPNYFKYKPDGSDIDFTNDYMVRRKKIKKVQNEKKSEKMQKSLDLSVLIFTR